MERQQVTCTDERLDCEAIRHALFWWAGVAGMCVLASVALGCASRAQLSETPPPFLLKGQVVADTQTERTLSGARVSLLVDSKPIITTTTDAEGHYSFGESPGAEFDIEVSKTGYATWRFSASHGRRLLDPANLGWQNRRLINVKLAAPPTVLRGRILSAVTREGLAGARVWTYPSTVRAIADDDGHYMVSSTIFEEDTDYHLTVSHTKHVNFLSSAFQVTTGDTLSLMDVALRLGESKHWDTSPPSERTEMGLYDTGVVVPGSGG